jgi:hypothetical protein
VIDKVPVLLNILPIVGRGGYPHAAVAIVAARGRLAALGSPVVGHFWWPLAVGPAAHRRVPGQGLGPAVSRPRTTAAVA